MYIFSTIKETSDYLSRKKGQGLRIGFVPTMGALHEGHLSLMRRAKEENDLLAVSIFVNPIQFNNAQDLEKYPRDLAKDRALLEQVGCDVLFAPDADEMYPEPETTVYDFGPLEQVMEGASRKGHFNGVAVVVYKLFEIIEPDRAYFGEKDFQQLAIIKELVRKYKLPVEIVPCPIVREKDGLAMSSRNERLMENERKIAPKISQILKEAKTKTEELNPAELKIWVTEQFEKEPQFRLDYFEIADDTYLQTVENWNKNTGTMGFVAVFLGNVRLIDNIRFI
ncbi:MAG: pantoate--beta-alanine ligase [Bacteroidetes bacterium]|nr:MAG: pantoate--beta-alanine ligase [Bacteroidota bacterium]RLD68719.1 MAG: pantoate--beta-alanine ligase [Bacteroidota bacterium]RLD88968.1 MAG: pantoate--beta-alanine ligase [Bacteroidota bacterium]